jgi:hypothetical protein
MVFLVPLLWPLILPLMPVVWVLGMIESAVYLFETEEERLAREELWWQALSGGSRTGGC